MFKAGHPLRRKRLWISLLRRSVTPCLHCKEQNGIKITLMPSDRHCPVSSDTCSRSALGEKHPAAERSCLNCKQTSNDVGGGGRESVGRREERPVRGDRGGASSFCFSLQADWTNTDWLQKTRSLSSCLLAGVGPLRLLQEVSWITFVLRQMLEARAGPPRRADVCECVGTCVIHSFTTSFTKRGACFLTCAVSVSADVGVWACGARWRGVDSVKVF